MGKKKQNYNDLPVYRVVVTPDDDTTGVQQISLLSDPAIEVQGHYFGASDELILPPCHQTWDGTDNCQCIIIDGEWTTGENPCEFCLENKERWDNLNVNSRIKYKHKYESQRFKAIDEQKCIIAPILVPNKKIYRRDELGNEYMIVFYPEDIVTLAEKFNKRNNNTSFNVDHENVKAPVFLRENWLVMDSTYDKSKLYGYSLAPYSWVGLIKVEDDEFWNNDVKKLGRYSFSIEALLGRDLIKFGNILPKSESVKFTLEQLLNIASYTLKLLEK